QYSGINTGGGIYRGREDRTGCDPGIRGTGYNHGNLRSPEYGRGKCGAYQTGLQGIYDYRRNLRIYCRCICYDGWKIHELSFCVRACGCDYCATSALAEEYRHILDNAGE